jgi:hypothetical protein
MLLVLISAFAMSQAFRTAAAVMAAPLQQDFGLTPRQLGLFAGAFHFAFGGLQLFMARALTCMARGARCWLSSRWR